MDQKNDESIDEIDRDTLNHFIETKEFLAVIFCKYGAKVKKFAFTHN